jgi:hypothetical protein
VPTVRTTFVGAPVDPGVITRRRGLLVDLMPHPRFTNRCLQNYENRMGAAESAERDALDEAGDAGFGVPGIGARGHCPLFALSPSLTLGVKLAGR